MIQTKTVDITPMKITLPVIEMSQYDLGREVIIHMKDGSDWFDLTGYTAKLQGTKPSGFGYTVDGVVDGHDITFASNYDMTSEAGFIPSEVRLTKDGVSLGSLNVILHVEKTPHDVTVTDGSPESIIPEMTELVERAEAAAEVLLDCSAIATTLPAGSSATASYDVDNGVFHFGIPRGNKGETGDTGETGNGIASITKTGTSGLVDTYTIVYTDGTSTTFTVTNGRNGTGSVADVWQNGVSVLDGSTAKVTVPVLDVTQNGTSVLDGTTAKITTPTKTSDLTNDSGFVTSVPTKTSDLTNDSNFVSDGSYIHTDNNFTTAEKTKLSGIASGAEVNVQADWNETSSSSDAYIQNKPTIPIVPTNVSAFTNDAGYLTSFTETDPLFTSAFVGGGGSDAYIANANAPDKYIGLANGWISDKQNYPSEFSNAWGMLITKNRYNFGTSTALIVQTLIVENGKIWTRKCESGTWGSWVGNTASATVTLAVANWSNDTQTVTATGVTANNNIIVSPAPSSMSGYVGSGIACTAQASNSLTFTCTSTPSTAIVVNVLIVS